MAQFVKYVTHDLSVVSLSPKLGIEITQKKRKSFIHPFNNYLRVSAGQTDLNKREQVLDLTKVTPVSVSVCVCAHACVEGQGEGVLGRKDKQKRDQDNLRYQQML